MNIKSFFASFDLARLSLDSITGLIVMSSILLLADAFSPSHLVQDVFSDAPVAAVFGFFFLVGSAVTGLLVASIFQTFGRSYGQETWRPLWCEFEYRKDLMSKLGLTMSEFEWIYASKPPAPAPVADETKERTMLAMDDQAKLLRFTEVSGSSAWAMLVLSPAVGFFLQKEYGQGPLTCWLVAVLLALACMMLFLASFESLSKYERRKTAITLAEVRKQGPIAAQRAECPDVVFKDYFPYCLYAAAPFLLPLVFMGLLQIHALTPVQEATMELIGRTTDNKTPIIDLSADLGSATPADVSNSSLIYIVDKGGLPAALHLGTASQTDNPVELVNEAHLPPNYGGWTVMVSFDNSVAGQQFTKDEIVNINALLSFQTVQADGTVGTIPKSKLVPGKWLFPIVVSAGANNYVLGYVQVTIKASPPTDKPAGGDNTTQTQKTTVGDTETKAGKAVVTTVTVPQA